MCQKSTLKTKFLLGNEAIAAGALKGGVRFAASYPGTPSSEILPAFFSLAKEFNVEVEGGWMINEKVAFEAALAASWSHVDAMVSMKQVGLNVAADSLMSAAYTGTEAGFLVISVDDPGPYSSQTEQDSRFFAMFAKVPAFDPSSPQDAYTLVQEALDLSRKFKIPVLVRPVLRVAHSRESVGIEAPENSSPAPKFNKRPGVWTATPKFRYQLHKELNEKIEAISQLYNQEIEEQLSKIKSHRIFIASGALYNYLLDLGIEEILRIKMPFPLDASLLGSIVESFREVWVIEETYPVIELQIPDRRRVKGRLSGHVPKEGEITLQKLKEIIDPAERRVQVHFEDKKPRLCPGCGHRPVFYAMRKTFPKGIFPGDIGCYTLGTNIGAVDTFVCMGSSISMGLSLALLLNKEKEQPVVCTIGDSTFLHAGIPPLIEAVEKNAPMVVAILDNRTTAMTGGQPVAQTDLEALVKGCGVKKVEKVFAYDFEKVCKSLKDCWRYSYQNRTPSVLLCQCPCVVFGPKKSFGTPPEVIEEKCTNCGICYKIFECPAISEKDGKVVIDTILCTGCGVCRKVCPVNAIQ